MRHPGWLLMIVGLLIAATGLIWVLSPGLSWLGKLPGDVAYERGNVRFYFPLATCLLVSLALSAMLWLASFLTR